jgi:hypothetical protein
MKAQLSHVATWCLRPKNRPARGRGRGAGRAARPCLEKAPAKSPAQKALEKLGLRRDIDLALHLPLRYEDETRIVRWPTRATATWCRSRAW